MAGGGGGIQEAQIDRPSPKGAFFKDLKGTESSLAELLGSS